MDARGGAFLFDVRTRRMTPLEGETGLGTPISEREVELSRAYLGWCERTVRRGDCLGLLRGGTALDEDARFTLALALAKGVVLEEMWEAVKDMADPHAVLQAILWTAATYALLWTVPEPVTKGVAAVLSVALIGYVGVDTFWGLVQGFRRLMVESDQALTFEALRDAGERFGRVMGRDAARAFVMLATAAIGSTATTLGAKLPALSGGARASASLEAHSGVMYASVGQVESVALAVDGVTIALAPGAVAMSSPGTAGGASAAQPVRAGIRAWKSFSGFKKAMGPAGPGRQWHHIVEQTPGNASRFGPDALHNTENVIAIDARIHEQISAYYSSKQRVAGGRVGREWLREQSYAQQREFGLRVLKQFGVVP
ncbi:hypothetical protein LY474_23785 [Myxococcus stipitatus]|uniref:SitA5 family polymorphic toxin n=1 Tax=Myxococcus stipitatus TaxID=83455 RepID=UPI001F2D0821|nr:hypothetical protein [Myxococcus stipitatus]MCE9670833.1 hypothetical protein [Myxococcus stipitatus]